MNCAIDSFSELIRVHCKDTPVHQLKYAMGWPYHRARSAKMGTLRADQISFSDGVKLAMYFGIDPSDLAASTGNK